MTAHSHTRTVQRRFGLTPHVTYSCTTCSFTVTDDGASAKKAWLRHVLNVKAGEVASNG